MRPLRALSAGILATLSACVQTLGPGTELSDGKIVSDLITRGRPAAVLYYSPADCFSCVTLLPEWIRLQQAGHVDVFVILSRAPSESEERALSVQRIRVTGQMHARWWERSPESGSEMLLGIDGGVRAGPSSPSGVDGNDVLRAALTLSDSLAATASR